MTTFIIQLEVILTKWIEKNVLYIALEFNEFSVVHALICVGC